MLECYLEEDPDQLAPEDRALVASWRLKVTGDFFVVRHLKKFSVFLDERPPGHLYGVVGLQSAVRGMLRQPLPIHVTALLLPFLGKIVTDGLLRSSPVHFGRTSATASTRPIGASNLAKASARAWMPRSLTESAG